MTDNRTYDDEALAFEIAEWPTADKSIATFRLMVAEHCSFMIDGTFVDMQTANAIVTVYDALQPETQARFEQCSLSRMSSIAWKAVSR